MKIKNYSKIIMAWSSYFKVFKRTSDIRNIIEFLRKIIQLKKDSDGITSYVYFNNYISDWNQFDYLENSKTLNDKLTVYPSTELVDLKKAKNEKINLGFISSDFQLRHSVTFFLRSVISNYDKTKFNIFLYHNHNNIEDATTQEFNKQVFKNFHISNLKDIDVINKVRKDELDIIVDLNGFSTNHDWLCLKSLAPIQISWCGYTNTTGLKEMDYLIVDKLINLMKKIYILKK